ncbi:hypothetical protein CIL05_07925 [Virgibacillus profundi]|uniref:Sporulation membrane protein YtrI C-terminal domain-containing protein n=1 Tax=Virgibacillus profundi TaxID=2024555 RepID=A0A2A2IGW4_9BACI|nr:sporulation membrane protein YtrI [Virgibacillus profundi]PAV30390.1 hypothetical protein CIL05_07925 [Virgibacillus profundi]PXY54562.1 hypothetical protein CIT14_08010 [Virgibacillus profundi]
MHIPPYHKKQTWQYFFLGAVLGGIIAYFIVIYMYGSMYEDLLAENIDFQSKITDLENHNEALLKDKADLDEKAKEPLTVETIEVSIPNWEEVLPDRLIRRQLEELIKEEISHVVGQAVTLIDESEELLSATIENKAFTIDDFTYYFEIKKLTISPTLKIIVDAKLSN